MQAEYVTAIIEMALAEDIGPGDITAQLIPETLQSCAEIFSREAGVLCGQIFVDEIYQRLDPSIQIEWLLKDGEEFVVDQPFCRLQGTARVLLTGERLALNFLQTLSATASVTRQYVNILAGSKTTLLDTRKTIPGLRIAQKYAVRMGGGQNHRMGLYDAYLIKENHILACGSISNAVAEARDLLPDQCVEVEVENIEEFKQALAVGVDKIMLDNFSLEMIKEAVALNQGQTRLEVSGGMDLEKIKAVGETGVDYISVGVLTKNIRAVDLSMRLK